MRNKFYARAWRILRPIVLFFLPVELRGTENLEDEAAILCANHSSAWDPILLVLAMPQSFNLRIMAKKQLFSIPLVRWFLRNMGVFPVDRGNSDIGAVKTAISSLRDDWNLLIFPEGTRNKTDALLLPFKPGAVAIAQRGDAVIVPFAITGEYERKGGLKIVFGKAFSPADMSPEAATEKLYNEVRDLLTAR